MEKKVAIVQSCYIPWKGYFDLINMVDEFIIYDDIQFTRRDWRNRNIIKTSNGLQWLTIPVSVKGKYLQKINETEIEDKSWISKHWKTIKANYSRAKYFKQFSTFFESLYNQCINEHSLSQVNFKFMNEICSLLNISTNLTWSSDYKIDESLKKTERLLALCQLANATHYISGPSAKSYLDVELFKNIGIKISYMDYSGYQPYTQLYGEYESGVSILDLIFNTGPDAGLYMKSIKNESY